MFDIGWSEMAVIALIALIVIGPKDLPKTMKTIAQWMRKAKSLTREFQSGIDDMVREAELEDAKKALESTRGGNLQRTISNAIDPDDELGSEVRSVESEARRRDTDGEETPAGQSKPGPKVEDSSDGGNAARAASSMTSSKTAPPNSLGSQTSKTSQASGDSTATGGETAGAGADDEGSKKTA